MTDIYKVILIPDPVLRQAAQPVNRVDDAVRAQMEKMTQTMYAYEGIGLAANQVNLLNRVVIIDTGRRDGGAPNPIPMANPEIIWRSEELWKCKEGCLSIPGQYADVERPKSVRVRYLDPKSQMQELELSNLASTCIQHEIDHLDGKLFIDYLSRLKRELILERVEKEKQNAGEVL
jgi:peptide deformylase